MYINKEQIQKHVKTHSERSNEDRKAVTTLKLFLSTKDGKINENFSDDDKWPNTDGTFEFVPNPTVSRSPEQNFFVQIKGTSINSFTKEGKFKYSLKSLGFPAFIANKSTSDPGILFIVLNPLDKGKERVFWKYMSWEFVSSINYSNDSVTIDFGPENEIKYSDESIEEFCQKLVEITDNHSFITKLDEFSYSKKNILDMINFCNEEITRSIENGCILNDSRDNLSKKLLTKLDDFCSAVLLLNSLSDKKEEANISVAWETALLDIKTKYLANFYRGIKYRGKLIPEEGQSERLMLKYYDFLWQIKEFLKKEHNIEVLSNLNKFPLEIDELDNEYNKLVAKAVDSVKKSNKKPQSARYFIQKKTTFYVNNKRYYEITLQLASIYASKFNRLTVYSTENISTNYSIEIAYEESEISLWNVPVKIKLVTNWKVSISPRCLNKLAKILKISTKITSKHGEYEQLMNFLTTSGINFLQFIDISDSKFKESIDHIYKDTNTSEFKIVLEKLKKYFSKNCMTDGRNVIRYAIINLREDILENIYGDDKYGQTHLNYNQVKIARQCYPFEKNPYISNLIKKKTSESNFFNIINTAGDSNLNLYQPYFKIKNLIKKTGEIYFDISSIAPKEKIEQFNLGLDNWESREGYKINIDENQVCIDSYEKTTISILKKLIELSNNFDITRVENNKKYLKECVEEIDDMKKQAIKNVFVKSNLLLIYGAAGTGKTTLINHISRLTKNENKLFLTKTHTSLQNLQRRLKNIENANFSTIDKCTRKGVNLDYDVIIIDECTTIDNRTMEKFLSQINQDTLLVLAGDIYQIESIDFGNWFFYAKEIIKSEYSNVELLSTWRTNNKKLISLWNEVRDCKPLITEKLVIDGPYSKDINENILTKEDPDEVILCLNYDGKFGLNNMNSYFQNANKNKAITWGEWSYKIDDPILFCDTKRFTVLYNNLKGLIIDIEKLKNYIRFTIDVDIVLSEEECECDEIEFIKYTDKGTRIRFSVYEYNNETDEDAEEKRKKSVVPFHLAYAVSIHKAQGLEYNSVKVIIPRNNSEEITHGIFYTAITRARKSLKIFWSSETMNDIVKNFSLNIKKRNSLKIIKSELEKQPECEMCF